MVYPFENDNIHVKAFFPYADDSTNSLKADLKKFLKKRIPFYLLEDELLLWMFHQKENYFLVPARSNNRGIDLYFHFDLVVENPRDYNSPTGTTNFKYYYTKWSYDADELN